MYSPEPRISIPFIQLLGYSSDTSSSVCPGLSRTFLHTAVGSSNSLALSKAHHPLGCPKQKVKPSLSFISLIPLSKHINKSSLLFHYSLIPYFRPHLQVCEVTVLDFPYLRLLRFLRTESSF